MLRLKRAEEHATKRTLEKIEEDDRKTAELKERQRQMQQVMSLTLPGRERDVWDLASLGEEAKGGEPLFGGGGLFDSTCASILHSLLYTLDLSGRS